MLFPVTRLHEEGAGIAHGVFVNVPEARVPFAALPRFTLCLPGSWLAAISSAFLGAPSWGAEGLGIGSEGAEFESEALAIESEGRGSESEGREMESETL